jgi:hypothetical protein
MQGSTDSTSASTAAAGSDSRSLLAADSISSNACRVEPVRASARPRSISALAVTAFAIGNDSASPT